MRILRVFVFTMIAFLLYVQVSASTIYYTFQVVDDLGVGVAGATLTQTACKLLSTGGAVTFTATTVDLADGDYSLGYDPEANGEAVVKFSVTAVGHTFTGRNGIVSVIMVRDPSRIANGISSTGTVTPAAGFLASDTTSLNAITANLLNTSDSTYTVSGKIGNDIKSSGSASNPLATNFSTYGLNDGTVGGFLKGMYTGGLDGNNYLRVNVASITSGVQAPSGFLANEYTNIASQILNTPVDTTGSTITLKQANEIAVAIQTGNFSVSYNAGTRTQTTTYYKADRVTVIVTSVVVFDTTGRSVTKTITFTNL